MEIMTTWNTDFEFDLQRFANHTYTNTTSADPWQQTSGTYYTTDGENWVKAATGSAVSGIVAIYETAATANEGTLYVTSGDTVLNTLSKDLTVKVAAAMSMASDGTVSKTQAAGLVNLSATSSVSLTATGGGNNFVLNSSAIKSAAGNTLAINGGTVSLAKTVAATFTSDAGSSATASYAAPAQNDVITVTTSVGKVDVKAIPTVPAGTYTITNGGVVTTEATNEVSLYNTEATPTKIVTATSTTGTVLNLAAATTSTPAGISSATGAWGLVAAGTVLFGAGTVARSAATATLSGSTFTLTGGAYDAVNSNTAINASANDVKVGGVTFENSTPTGTNAQGKYTSNTNFTLTAGVATIDKTVTGTVTVNEATFTNNSASTDLQVAFLASKTGLYSGSTKASVGTYNTVYAAGGTTLTAGDQVIVTSSSNGVVISKANTANDTATVSGLDVVGESVTIKDGGGVNPDAVIEVVEVDGTKVTVINKTTGNLYTGTTTTAWDDTLSAGAAVVPADIDTTKYSATTRFNNIGIPVSSSATAVVGATLTVNGTSRTLTVNSDFKKNVSVANDTVKVEDKGTTSTKYTLSGTSAVTAKGLTFTSTNGIVSDASGTMVLDSAATTFSASGSVNVDASAATTPTLTYVAGADVSNAKVTINANQYFNLTESNSGDSAVNTVINLGTKHITGLDGDATITTSGISSNDILDITTTGSGTFTLNKTAYVVAGDDNGVTFAFDITAPTPVKDEIDAVTGLDQDATITVTKLSDAELSVNGTAFTAITAKNNIVFTGSKSDKTAATATVFTKGDTVKDANNNVYTVEAMGSNSDGIVITTGKITALNDGDKIRVDGTTAGSYTVYEVSGKLLVESVYTSASTTPTTTTYELNDADDPGFTISTITAGTGVGTIDNGKAGKTGQAVTFGTGTDTLPSTTLTDGEYITAEGTATATEKGAVAKISITDDLISYTSTSSKSQVVEVTTTSDNWSITTAAGKDTISMTAGVDATIDSGAGDDVITLGGKGDKVVNAGDGKNEVNVGGTGDVTLTLGSGKDTVTALAGNTGDLVITAAGGNNKIDLSAKTKGDVTVTGGAGDDTITASSADDVISGNGGKNTFYVGTGIKVSDYSFESDVIFTNGAGFGVTDEGKVTTAGGSADISTTAGDYYVAQIKSGTAASPGKAQYWAWAKDGGSTIDVTTFTKDAHLRGDADGASALYAGSGDDVITALADGDSVYGGAGKNTINLLSGEKRVVGVSASAKGKDTVTGFKASFEDEGDSFFMVDGNLSDTTVTIDTVSGSSANLTLKNGGSSVSLVGAGVNTVTGAVEIKAGTTKLAAINKNATAKVDSASYADAYIGKDSAVDFSAVDGELYVDLSNNLTASGNGPKFVGITSVSGGTGDNTLMGSAKADYVVAGTGKTSLYGGAGSDTLVGNGEADVFFFGDGTNTNTIEKYQAAGVDNADTIKILGDVASAKLNSNTIQLGSADGSKAIIKSLATGSINANTMVKIEANNFTGVAKLGESSKANNFTYDSSVSFYGGGSASDKISVASSFSDNAEVWLDGSKGVAYGSIDVVDFKNGTGNYVLAGDSSKNTIVGGKGDSSLWGGAGSSADSVVGTAGGTTKFFFGLGEGNDTLVAGSANDSVNLYNISLSDIAGGEITGSGVKLVTTAGDNMYVNTGNKNIKFTLSDGSSYIANQSTRGWDQG